MIQNNYCVIMAGGIGSRFWPMSRNAHPKQFIDILGSGLTLLQQTYRRFAGICPKENIYVITSDTYVGLVRQQLPDLGDSNIIAEPQRRNTAPCVVYSAFKIFRGNPDANIVVAPSDHLVSDEESFCEAVRKGLDFTEQHNGLLTIGIRPSRPDTGYGYIQVKDGKTDERFPILQVKTFTEKPNLEMAKFFLKSGEFLWNSGIFLWKAKTILDAFSEHLPDMYALFREGLPVFGTPKEAEFIQRTYAQTINISIDYGIMEKAKNVYTLSAEFGWSDLGTWKSLYENLHRDGEENAVVGPHVMLDNTRNCIINIPQNKLAVIMGLDNYIVVESDNVLLICPKDDEQQVRNIVNDVKLRKGEKYV
jgi:mannose-1-phosphate guanylyltransferase